MGIERREQVFVSSTYVDLVEERQEVIQTLLEADCIPAGMELFPASDDDRWTLIKRVIDDCDYYVVVIGGRYGSVDPDTELSYTEMELDYAVEAGKPVLGFLHGNPGAIPADKTDLSEDARRKLNELRDKVAEKVVKFWENPSELGGQVAKSLIQIRKTHPAEGWVRARDAATPEMQSELVELRARVAELTAELDSAEQATRAVPQADLAQAEDAYGMAFRLRYWTAQQIQDGKYRHAAHTYRSFFDATWNEVFAAIGPLMIDEASEANLRSTLDSFVATHLTTADLPDDFEQVRDLVAESDVIHDVKIQFFALGLIAQSERRRPVSDSNTYWTLTPAGRDHLMRMRAIRRPQGSEQNSDEAEDDA